MRVSEYLDQAKGATLLSFEVLPPLKGGTMQDIFNILDPLMEFKPPFIDVTYHREEFIYKKMDSGYYEKTAIRKRPGTVGICASIMHRYGVDAIPHLICGGFSKEETENALIDLHFLGINNVLALRGDARQFEDRFIGEEGGHNYAVDLVKQIHNMNRGIYLDTNIANGARTQFCIGVAGYPEKHFEAPNMAIDLEYLKKKMDAGAEYIVTQMFFDNSRFFKFVESCRSIGIHAPIIPGLKPLTSAKQIHTLPRKFFVSMPEELIREVLNNQDNGRVKEIGIEWCRQQSKELKAAGVPCIHYYTMGDTDTIIQVVRDL